MEKLVLGKKNQNKTRTGGENERGFIVLLLVPAVALVWYWFPLLAHGSAETQRLLLESE